jgi:hypothetical protein
VTFKPLLMQVTVLYGKSLEGESEFFSNFLHAGSGRGCLDGGEIQNFRAKKFIFSALRELPGNARR